MQTNDDYIKALNTLLADSKAREGLKTDPVGTLERLGMRLPEEARRRLQDPAAVRSLTETEGEAAWTLPVVRIATQGTRPAVQVAVSVAVASVKAETGKEEK